MRKMKALTIEVRIVGHTERMTFNRHLWDHLMICIGYEPMPCGEFDPAALLTAVDCVQRQLNGGHAREFTRSEETIKHGIETITMRRLDIADVEKGLVLLRTIASNANAKRALLNYG